MKTLRIIFRAFPLGILALLASVMILALVGRLERTIESDGSVQAWSYQVVRPQRAGFVAQLLVRPGDRVTAGQALARLEEPGFTRQLFDAQKGLAETAVELAAKRAEKRMGHERLHPLELERQRGKITQSRLDAELAASLYRTAELALETVRQKLGRVKELDRHGIVSEQGIGESEQEVLAAAERLVQHRLAEELARERIAASERALLLLEGEQEQRWMALDAEIYQLETEHEMWQGQLERLQGLEELHTLRAELDGVVVGEPNNDLLRSYVDAGDALFQVIDPSSIQFLSHIPEEAMVQVRPGQEAIVELVGLPKNRFKAFTGRVHRIDQQPLADIDGIPKYPVEIQIDQPWISLADGPFFLTHGMRGTARVVYQRDVPVMKVLYEILAGAPSTPEPIAAETGRENSSSRNRAAM